MKKKIVLTVIAVLLVITLIVGISYAYWKTTYQATNINKIVSSCFSMEITNEKNNIILDDAYPITDERGKSLTPYSFTITNTCDLFASYTVNLEMLEGTTLNSKYIKTMINNEAITNLSTLETTDPSIEGAVESRILFRGSLGSGDSTDYTFRVWMDYDTPNNEESMNKSFQGKITVTAEVSTYSPVENGFTNLAEALLVNEYQTTSVDVAKNKIASKQEVDFTKTAPIIEWQPLTMTSTMKLSVTKVAPADVGINNIHVNASKIVLGKSYLFNPASGYYTIMDRAYYDPSSLDYEEADYYICGSTITTTQNNSVEYWDGVDCPIIYRINNLASVVDGTIALSGGDSVNTKKYVLNVYKMYETELESDKSDKGLYDSLDDYGTTYYYRGNVTNNYVKFAGYYWRIVRINGDGSIRILYSGNMTDTNSFTIGNGQYHSIKTNPTYVGYMYSNTLNSSYEETIKNDNNSTAKDVMDNWYKKNILDKGYFSYIVDSGFCNDRSIASNSSGDGSSSNSQVYYASRVRLFGHNPSFICPNPTNDLFTLTDNHIGNKILTYPIGLITADELAFAGFSYGYLNKMSYTYSNSSYWTMTPEIFSDSVSTARVWRAQGDGAIGFGSVTDVGNFRPVINLKADTEISGGIGTKNDPFIVK